MRKSEFRGLYKVYDHNRKDIQKNKQNVTIFVVFLGFDWSYGFSTLFTIRR